MHRNCRKEVLHVIRMYVFQKLVGDQANLATQNGRLSSGSTLRINIDTNYYQHAKFGTLFQVCTVAELNSWI